MKKTIMTLACALACCTCLFGQGKVTTRKYRLADFTDNITKVVLTGNTVLDGALRQEVVKYWTASPFEFCGADDFEINKTSDSFYFLIAAESRFKGEVTPGIVFLTLVKGSPEAGEGISGMHEVISLPLCAAQFNSGRELIYIGALVENIQNFTLQAMNSERTAYSKDDWFNSNYTRWGKMKSIWLSADDLAGEIPEKLKSVIDSDFHFVDEDTADGKYIAGEFNTLVGYTVSPFEPSAGSYSYTMLFEAGTHKLYYIYRHKISAKEGPGFTQDDIKRMLKSR